MDQSLLDTRRRETTHGDLGSSSNGSFARSNDLDNVTRSSVLDVLGVNDLASGGVVVPSRHDDLDAVLALKLLERRSALADDRRVKSVRDGDSVNDARLEALDLLGEEGVDLLGDGLGRGDDDRVGAVALAREANGVAGSASVAGSSCAGDEVANCTARELVRSPARRGEERTAGSTGADEGRVEGARDLNRQAGLVVDLLRDGEDHLLGRRGSRLGTAKSDVRRDGVGASLVDVDRDRSLVLDLVDLDSSLAEDAREGLDRDGEVEDVPVLLLVGDEVDELLLCRGGALLRAANGDLVGVALLLDVVVSALATVAREVDPDVVGRLEALEVRSLLADEGSTLEGRGEGDGEGDLVGLRMPNQSASVLLRRAQATHELLDETDDPLLRLLGVLLATLDDDLALRRPLGASGGLLLKVDSDAQLLAKLVDSSSRLADDLRARRVS